MEESFIDYGQLIDEAMHIIVKKALERVSKEGLPGEHHFFISFLTGHPGVSVSEALRKKYPEEMTIVLQHQFDGLRVTDKGFRVSLSFDNVKENIEVSFDALVAFADPSVKFGLQFRHMDELDDEEFSDLEDFPFSEEDAVGNVEKESKKKKTVKKPSKSGNNVIQIDSFRKE